jgi:hypothetical protein
MSWTEIFALMSTVLFAFGMLAGFNWFVITLAISKEVKPLREKQNALEEDIKEIKSRNEKELVELKQGQEKETVILRQMLTDLFSEVKFMRQDFNNLQLKLEGEFVKKADCGEIQKQR